MTDDEVPRYGVHELAFEGPSCGTDDAPAADVSFATVWRHESGTRREVHGFYDGDGAGGRSGDVFRVRFCPTATGEWTLARTVSNRPELSGRREGHTVACVASKHPGFWEVDDEHAGGRWFRRSNGDHDYLVGNTHYSFLSGRTADGEKEHTIGEDVRANAEYFGKLRFGLGGDRYPHPEAKPFLDAGGEPTDDGDHSHRPNPAWFRERVDAAVATAHEVDLVADLILAGPDAEATRSTLRAGENGGDPEPFLRYVAARYGSYPNVWFCLSNEWDIRVPRFTPRGIAAAGHTLREHLPYPTPVSVHGTPGPFHPELVTDPQWHTHAIVQQKLKELHESASVLRQNHRIAGGVPAVNDELAYQGEGDGWTREDVVEAAVGALAGCGYASTGYKPGDKVTHYFWGDFDPDEHTAAEHLRWLADRVDEHVTFWRLEPVDLAGSVFEGVRTSDWVDEFRAAAWPGREHVLASDARREGVARLPPGEWERVTLDVLATSEAVATERVDGSGMAFETPDSRAGLTLFRRVDGDDG